MAAIRGPVVRLRNGIRCTAVAATAAVTVLGLAALEAAAATPYEFVFEGTFRLSFGTGEGFTDELTFSGSGGGPPVGDADIEGYSRARGGPDGCSTIEHDEVTITSAAGDRLLLVNAGTDCVDVLSEPGSILIHGSGTTAVVGGTGAFAGASGSGTWTVEAEVTGVGPGHVTGTFGPLAFVGALD